MGTRITEHPILGVPQKGSLVSFTYDGKKIQGYEGEPIAAALKAAGIQIHRYTKKEHTPRGIFCAIGRCTDCVMVVDGVPKPYRGGDLDAAVRALLAEVFESGETRTGENRMVEPDGTEQQQTAAAEAVAQAAGGDQEPERPVDREQHDRDAEVGRALQHDEDRAEREETADRTQVGRGAGEELPALPAFVEAQRQALQVLVQVGAQRGFDADGAGRVGPASDVVAHLDEQGRCDGQRGEDEMSVGGPGPDRTVDQALREQRADDLQGLARAGGDQHDEEATCVRTCVRPQPQQCF